MHNQYATTGGARTQPYNYPKHRIPDTVINQLIDMDNPTGLSIRLIADLTNADYNEDFISYNTVH